MKLHTKIISLLLVAGLASAGAQSAGSSASNFYLKGSVGSADLQSDGGLTKKTKGFAAMSGMDLKLDSAVSYSFEGGMYYGENLSFGFEWTAFNSDSEASRNFTESVSGVTRAQLDAINAALGWRLGVGAVTAFEEEIDMDRFMFVLNYEHYFTEQFSLLVNTGLGVLNVEQKIKVYEVTPLVQRINSKADDTVLAYQLGVSLGYHFNEALSFYGGARFLGASDIDFEQKLPDDTKVKFDGFNPDALVYEVGMRYSF